MLTNQKTLMNNTDREDLDLTWNVYGKKEIMSIFNCESDKALRILKFMQQCGYATKIGREYYTMQMQLDEFMTQSMGKSIYV